MLHVRNPLQTAQMPLELWDSPHVPSRKRVGVDLRKAEELLALDGARVVLE